MQRHPVIGHEILKGSASKYVRMGALIALGHHERYDGKGYPNGLDGDHIPLCARVGRRCRRVRRAHLGAAVQEGLEAADALDYIKRAARKHFDPRLVDAFLGVSERVLEVQRDLQDRGAEGGSK
jgi:two-component system response regulator RpfG